MKGKVNNVYFVGASNYWPVGTAGAVIIAADAARAKKLAEDLGLLKPATPTCVGISQLKEQVVFFNTTNY